MKIPFGNLKMHYQQVKNEIDDAIWRVLSAGWYILGEEGEAFEDEFSRYCGVSYGVGVGSGTEALHLALVAAGVKTGDEVITVPNTAIPTISAISFAGAVPVLVDIDPDTYTMDPGKVEAVITNKTKAIIPVHLYGQCADMNPIINVARKYKLTVIEDACQAHGALYKGQRAGSLGDLACFSFYPSKNLGAFGDGGMVVTNNKELANRLRMLRNYGQEKRYHHKIKGFNSRLDEMQAAILRIKLKHLNAWNRIRTEKAGLYFKLLNEFPDVIMPIEMSYAKHVYHLFVIRHKKRNELQNFLMNNGIETLIHYPVPVHLQESYQDLGYKCDEFSITEGSAETILSLPLYPEIEDDGIRYIAEKIKEFVTLKA
ncbi:MAG: pyridoxal phosphate-dependent protein [Candidatus Saganbacteria bacterium]|uniref:Pyridoxal phosphate-dependent protein n=1 Tax=Candidatus Saganbacteria bacterium TaxID=2575572 RepID=A0A833L2I9_UNCSA|nr:MAG: pyridoxal phosphate-dependent protein [Candidatus Saganbacteria bacterium]